MAKLSLITGSIGLRRLCRDVKAVSRSLTYKQGDMTPVELGMRDKLKWTGGGEVSAA